MITNFLNWLFTRDWIWGAAPKLQDAQPILKKLLSHAESRCGIMVVSPEDYDALLSSLKERGPVVYSGQGFLFDGFRVVPDERIGEGKDFAIKIFE